MGKSYVKDIDRGYKKIKQELIKLRKQEVAVGLQAGDMANDGKMTVARLGAIHEFGCTIEQGPRKITTYHRVLFTVSMNKERQVEIHAKLSRFMKKRRANTSRTHDVGPYSIDIPERPFLRSTFDEKHKEWEQKAAKQLDMVASGRKDAIGMLNTLGNVVEGDIKRKIASGPFTPNAPSTVRQKKSAKPLIDSGRMRSSVRYIIRGRGEGKNK